MWPQGTGQWSKRRDREPAKGPLLTPGSNDRKSGVNGKKRVRMDTLQ